MPTSLKSQGQWLATIKTHGCNSCHQIGNKPTRTISPALGTFANSFEAWSHRVQVGPAAETMVVDIGEIDTQRALQNFADWSDRIAAGELPKSKPQRPAGIERNVVITMWDLGRRQDLPARRDRERQARSDRQPVRQDLQRHRRL